LTAWESAAIGARMMPADAVVRAALRAYDRDRGRQMRGRRDDHLLRLPHPPTAVVVANVAPAIGALHAAHGLGARVTDEVSVIARARPATCRYLAPPLTTVRMPLARLGAQAVELLLSNGSDAPISETLSEPIELVKRESTAAPPPALRLAGHGSRACLDDSASIVEFVAEAVHRVLGQPRRQRPRAQPRPPPDHPHRLPHVV
jgi:Periplasmic binding protein-like domain